MHEPKMRKEKKNFFKNVWKKRVAFNSRACVIYFELQGFLIMNMFYLSEVKN